MRYRRLSYRHAVMVTTNQGRPFGDVRQVDQIGPRFAQTYWRPAADVCESERAIEVIVDLAGVDQDELDVVIYQDAVIVAGQRRLSSAGPHGVYHVAEIRQGPFRLELPLPVAIDQERVEARHDRGLLRITFPKLAQTGMR
jgi:HSP20 family molecular chaperone IbpA